MKILFMMIVRIGFLAIGTQILSCSPIQAQYNLTDQQSAQVEAFSQTPKSNTAPYNPSFGRLSLQYGSGLLFGAVGGIVGGLASVGIMVPDTGGGFATQGYGMLGAMVSYIPSSALGVYIVANSGRYDASYGNILLGSALGTAAGIGTVILTSSTFGKGAPIAIAGFAAVSSVIVGGMIANSTSIDRRSGSSTTALLNLSKGKATMSSPSINLPSMKKHHYLSSQNTGGTPVTVALVNISL